MRAISLFLTAAALLTTVSTAQAGPGATEAVSASVQQMDQVTGAYKLSDGRRAEIFALGTRLYVKIGRGQQKELQLAGPDRFASTDGRISIQFGPELATERIVIAQDPSVIQPDKIRLASNDRAGRGSAD